MGKKTKLGKREGENKQKLGRERSKKLPNHKLNGPLEREGERDD